MARPLDEYRRKRDFGRTPEPAPGAPPTREGDPVFVVHRHDARNLHYDLRLEMEGVLKSWAVPKGFSYDPADKRLAVRTEDHPMEYESFEGVIPRGEYGAGTLQIWDRGRYRILGDKGVEGVKDGKLEVELRGRRLRGEWHLVRTKGEGRQEPWLLFKARDLYARTEGGAQHGPDLVDAAESPFPRTRAPMGTGGDAAPFSDPGWVFEMEFEGRRAMVYKERDRVRWQGEGLPKQPPAALERGAAALRARETVMDGVLVVVDDKGRPSRALLDAVLAGDSEEPVCFYAFDLVQYEEWDLRAVPLVDRKAVLRSLVPETGSILFVDHVPGSGEALARTAAQAGLSGLVAKRAGSTYAPGPSEDWLRIPIAPAEESRDRDLSDTLATTGTPRSSRVPFSNPDKIFWPELGITKGALIDYYAQVAEFLLPYVRDRAIHMRRCPDGIHGEFFYQRRAPDHLPDWIDTADMVGSDGEVTRHMVCNHVDALLYLVNLGSIDLHPWLSRIQTPDEPDWAVIDLDPNGVPFRDVIRVARAVSKVLEAIEVKAGLKTSGSTGLHIYIPLKGGYTYEHVRMFCEGIGLLVTKEHPDLCTIERVPSRRGGKLYVDFLQNARGQTVVPPYVVRPVPDATVSTPLHWEELEDTLLPAHHTLINVPARLSQQGDLFASLADQPQDLYVAATALQDLLTG